MRRVAALALAGLFALGSPAAARSVLFEGAVGGAHERPGTLSLSADGTLEGFNMKWIFWGGSVAIAHGNIEWHGCKPSCGAAPAHHARGSVHLSDIHYCEERAYYSKVTVFIYTRRGLRLLDNVGIRYAPC